MNYKTHSRKFTKGADEKGLFEKEHFDIVSLYVYLGVAALMAPIIAMTLWLGVLLQP